MITSAAQIAKKTIALPAIPRFAEQLESPGGKSALLRCLQNVLFGTDGVRARPRRSSYQIPVRLGVGRLQVFGVLAPANAPSRTESDSIWR